MVLDHFSGGSESLFSWNLSKTIVFIGRTPLWPSKFISWNHRIPFDRTLASAWNSSRIAFTPHFASTRAQLWSNKSVLNTIYYTWATLLEACFRPPGEPMGSQNHPKAPFDPPGRPWVPFGPAKMLSHDVPILNLATQKSRLLFLFLFGLQFYNFHIFLLLFLS